MTINIVTLQSINNVYLFALKPALHAWSFVTQNYKNLSSEWLTNNMCRKQKHILTLGHKNFYLFINNYWDTVIYIQHFVKSGLPITVLLRYLVEFWVVAMDDGLILHIVCCLQLWFTSKEILKIMHAGA